MRLAFDAVKKPGLNGTMECDVLLLETKLREKGTEAFKSFKRVYD